MTPLIPKQTTSVHQARGVLIKTLLLNLLVASAKIIWGLLTHTLSMTADGFHSLLDGFSNVVGIIALSISSKPADPDHPYGHRKFEAMAAMLISFFIFLTSFEIITEAFQRFFSEEHTQPSVNAISYLIILLTMAVNIFVTRYESRKGRELKSDLLLADSQHTLSDVYASLSVLVSLVAIQLGWLWLDTVIAIIIVAIILRAGYNIIMTHLGSLVDEAVLDPKKVVQIVIGVPGVLGCHKIRSRGMPNHVFLDLHIQVNPNLTVKEAHQISYLVEEALMKRFEGRLADVLVHIEEDEHYEYKAQRDFSV